MATRWTPVGIPALAIASALFLAACGGDDEAADTVATDTVATTVAPTSSAAPATTAAPASTAAPTTTPADGSTDVPVVPPDDSSDVPVVPPVDTSDAPILISVEVGVDDAPDRIETVPVGAVVTLSVVDPAAEQEYHLHDYDLGDDQVIPAGQTATFTFVADRTGDFEFESHVTEDVLLVLRVV